MAAGQVRCWQCDKTFYGRSDAHYCSNACRQKAHRSRTARTIAEKTFTAPDLGDVVTQARATRQRAREVRAAASMARHRASEMRAKVDPH
jgi:hypothetical protein